MRQRTYTGTPARAGIIRKWAVRDASGTVTVAAWPPLRAVAGVELVIDLGLVDHALEPVGFGCYIEPSPEEAQDPARAELDWVPFKLHQGPVQLIAVDESEPPT